MQVSESSSALILESVFSSNKIKPELVLVSGTKGAGKTRLCMDLVEHAYVRGLKLRGLISPAIFENDTKVGIDLMDLHTGERRTLAFRAGVEQGDFRTINWQMVAETLEWGNTILKQIDSCDLFILDEVGPLEFEQGVGLMIGLEILDSRKKFPAVVVVRPSLLSTARRRWPWYQLVDVPARVVA